MNKPQSKQLIPAAFNSNHLQMMNGQQPINHLLVIEGTRDKRTVALDQNRYSIGRHYKNSIILSDPKVSRYHATLLRKKDSKNDNYSFWLIDGDSQGNKSNNGIYINGQRSEEKELQHGDIISFSSEVKARYYIVNQDSPSPIFDVGEQLLNKSIPTRRKRVLSDQMKKTQIINEQTVKDSLQEFSHSDLVRLASFPELSPSPIIEINFSGQVTYLNPAASRKFKDIEQHQLAHPLLADLLTKSPNRNGNLFVREVKLEEEIYEQYVHYLADSQLIRSYIFDITGRKLSEEMMKYQAFHDLLTGLPNRTLFNEHLATALANAERNGHPMAVMFLDLDRFKKINDTLGHAIGDKLLQDFSKRLQQCLRAGDTVARWGGDEFTILLPTISNAEEAAQISQRIISAMKPAFELEEHELYITTSVGIALYPQDGKDGGTLLRNADAALYRTKEQGRNNYQFYSPNINFQASVLLKLENHLHHALERGELSVHYQPQVKISNQKILGVEALLRWNHHEFGNISPEKFIPLAEETGLIIPIGEWVLETACAQNRAWQAAGLPPVKISVNLSPRQFQDPHLVSMVGRILAKTGLEAKWLELEITESTIMQNVELARQSLQELLEMGVHISMDDFGTGYSSLGYLKKFPFHTLKIDRSFVQELHNNQADLAIIAAVIALGAGLNLRVIAEGVETQQQLQLLQGLKCEEMQGSFFSPPVNASAVTELLAKHL